MIKGILISLTILFLYSCSSQDKKPNDNSIKAIEFNNLAMELMTQGKYDSALVVFDKAVEIDKSNYLSHSNKSNIYVMRKEFDKALIEIEKVLEKKPDLAEMRVFSGMLYGIIGDTLKAKKHYKKSIEIFSNRISDPSQKDMISANKINKACSYIFLGETERGKSELIKLKQFEPNNVLIDELLTMDKDKIINQIFQLNKQSN